MLFSKFAQACFRGRQFAPSARSRLLCLTGVSVGIVLHGNLRPRFLVAPQDRPIHRHPASPAHSRPVCLHYGIRPAVTPGGNDTELQPHARVAVPGGLVSGLCGRGIPRLVLWKALLLAGLCALTGGVAYRRTGSRLWGVAAAWASSLAIESPRTGPVFSATSLPRPSSPYWKAGAVCGCSRCCRWFGQLPRRVFPRLGGVRGVLRGGRAAPLRRCPAPACRERSGCAPFWPQPKWIQCASHGPPLPAKPLAGHPHRMDPGRSLGSALRLRRSALCCPLGDAGLLGGVYARPTGSCLPALPPQRSRRFAMRCWWGCWHPS